MAMRDWAKHDMALRGEIGGGVGKRVESALSH
jgi:hypothetical protein